jgi:hypothetical protein
LPGFFEHCRVADGATGDDHIGKVDHAAEDGLANHTSASNLASQNAAWSLKNRIIELGRAIEDRSLKRGVSQGRPVIFIARRRSEETLQQGLGDWHARASSRRPHWESHAGSPTPSCRIGGAPGFESLPDRNDAPGRSWTVDT